MKSDSLLVSEVEQPESTEDKEPLYKMLGAVQELMGLYRVNDASLTGSYLYGTTNAFSDLDLVINVETLYKKVLENKSLAPLILERYSGAKHFILESVEPLSNRLAEILNIDIHLNVMYDHNEFQSYPLTEKGLPFIENSKNIPIESVIKQLRKIRSEYVVENMEYSEAFLIVNLGHIIDLVRFHPYITDYITFSNPQNILSRAITGQMIHQIGSMALAYQKFTDEQLNKYKLPVAKLRELTDLIHRGMENTGICRPMKVGWTVYTVETIPDYDKRLIWDIFEQLKPSAIRLLEVERVTNDERGVYQRYLNAMKNSAGFRKHIVSKLKSESGSCLPKFIKTQQLVEAILNDCALKIK